MFPVTPLQKMSLYTFYLDFTSYKGCKIPITCWEIKLHIKSRRGTTLQVRGLSTCLSHLNEDWYWILFRLECTNIMYGRRLFPCSSFYLSTVPVLPPRFCYAENPGAGPLCFMTSVKSLSIIYGLHCGKIRLTQNV